MIIYFQITYQYENFYGTLYSELYQNNIVSLTPDGLRQYQLYENLRLAIIYLDCDIEICKQRVIKRGDDLIKFEARIKSDKSWLETVRSSADFVIKSSCDPISDYEDIYNFIKRFFKI